MPSADDETRCALARWRNTRPIWNEGCVLALPRRSEAAEAMHRRIARDRAHLFLFVTDRAVSATNNACERALRPSVIVRKVTNGFRSEWAHKPMPLAAPPAAPHRPTAAPSSAIFATRWQPRQHTRPRCEWGELLHRSVCLRKRLTHSK